MNREEKLKIAKLAYSEISSAIIDIETKHNIYCIRPPWIEVDGERFDTIEFDDDQHE